MESYFTKTIDWKMTIGHIFKTKNCGDIRILKQYGDFVDLTEELLADVDNVLDGLRGYK